MILANAISVSKLTDTMTNAILWARDSIESKMESRFDLEVSEKVRRASRFCGRESYCITDDDNGLVEVCMMGPLMRGYVKRRTMSKRSARFHILVVTKFL